MIKDWLKQRNLERRKRQLDEKYYNTNLVKLDGEIDSESKLNYTIASENLRKQIHQLETSRLIRKAIKLGIDLPATELFTQDYIKKNNETTQCNYLKPFEQNKFKRLIRIEQRNNLEFWIKNLIPIITTLTGLIGVIIGLIAVLKK